MTLRKKILAVALAMSTVAAAQAVPQEAYMASKAAGQAVRSANAPTAATNVANANAAAALPGINRPGLRTSNTAMLVTAKAVSRSVGPKDKRDPFVSVIRNRSLPVPECAGGRKCLAVNEITLKGVVKGPEGAMAVVENGKHTAYFLRENDPVFNGQVLHISANSITIREKVLDKLGREKSREVVKSIAGAKPGV